MRFTWDLPFAVHFHLHPTVQAEVGAAPDHVRLFLASGERWRLTAAGAVVAIEESTHYAVPVASGLAEQVVLRASCPGAAEVSWVLERVG